VIKAVECPGGLITPPTRFAGPISHSLHPPARPPAGVSCWSPWGQFSESGGSGHLGLQEALVNAVRHGNGNDPKQMPAHSAGSSPPRWTFSGDPGLKGSAFA